MSEWPTFDEMREANRELAELDEIVCGPHLHIVFTPEELARMTDYQRRSIITLRGITNT